MFIMASNKVNELIRLAGSPVTVHGESTTIDVQMVALPEDGAEFLAPRDVEIPSGGWFRWDGQEYRILKVKPSQLGDIVVCSNLSS